MQASLELLRVNQVPSKIKSQSPVLLGIEQKLQKSSVNAKS